MDYPKHVFVEIKKKKNIKWIPLLSEDIMSELRINTAVSNNSKLKKTSCFQYTPQKVS